MCCRSEFRSGGTSVQVAISHSSPGLVTPEVQKATLTSALVLLHHMNKCRKHQGCVTAARKHVNTHWVVTHTFSILFLGSISNVQSSGWELLCLKRPPHKRDVCPVHQWVQLVRNAFAKIQKASEHCLWPAIFPVSLKCLAQKRANSSVFLLNLGSTRSWPQPWEQPQTDPQHKNGLVREESTTEMKYIEKIEIPPGWLLGTTTIQTFSKSLNEVRWWKDFFPFFICTLKIETKMYKEEVERRKKW